MALRGPPVLRVRRALYAADVACPFATRNQQIRTIRTIRKKVPPVSRFNTAFMPMRASPAAALARKEASDTLPLRSGVLATKKGMSAMYDPDTGKRTPCTVLQLDRVQVIGNKTRAKNGYFAVCVGHSWRTPQRVGNAMLGVFAKAQYENEAGGMVGVSPKKEIREFRVRNASGLLKVGDIISPSWFQEGQFIDARATSKGHGFTGVMKRHGFGGQPASHGVSLTHRSMGSSGGGQGSGSRVHPGKKMAGRMGGQRHTVQNLKVLKIDDENGLVVVHGGVSGPKGCLVQLQDALKKPWPETNSGSSVGQQVVEGQRQTVQV